MKIILYQPQIPQNTGNIIRTCAVTGTELILVRPLGFSIADRWLKRAGLDYFENVPFQVIDSLEHYLQTTNLNFYFFSSKASKIYTETSFTKDDILIFGSETNGLPLEFHKKWDKQFLKLPMQPNQRCLNLATTAGIAVYEAWRQLGFST
ncbi:putative tRNA (cytidine(34)-2'-O)-methyltransferase [Chlamydiales bacterium STE3]|nr:putative tRNA (cytidine(34)-2'-O)-methyltransferase [Chlamydiales bacterium STE3]